MRIRARTRRPGPVHGLAGDRAQPRRQRTSTSPPRAATRSPSSAATRAPARSGSRRERRAASRPKAPSGCATAIGLDGPNSVAVSPDGRNVYATSRGEQLGHASSAATAKTGALRQLPPPPAASPALPLPGCATGRALLGPDVVVVSPDGKNVYVGSFFGNAVAVFDRDPHPAAR